MIISLFKFWIDRKFVSIKSETQLETLDGKRQSKQWSAACIIERRVLSFRNTLSVIKSKAALQPYKGRGLLRIFQAKGLLEHLLENPLVTNAGVNLEQKLDIGK